MRTESSCHGLLLYLQVGVSKLTSPRACLSYVYVFFCLGLSHDAVADAGDSCTVMLSMLPFLPPVFLGRGAGRGFCSLCAFRVLYLGLH
jgi:hypothetical protein